MARRLRTVCITAVVILLGYLLLATWVQTWAASYPRAAGPSGLWCEGR
jgi:hypothetical protein